MANKKEVKQHIDSISDIRTITNAMYLIASTKLRRAKENLKNARPCFNALEKTMHFLATDNYAKNTKYFRTAGEKPGIVVITADKGLAGAYNYNVIRRTLALLEEMPEAIIFPVGTYGRQYFIKHNANVCEGFIFSSEGHTLRNARRMCEELMQKYDDNVLNEIHVVFTDFTGGLSSAVKVKKLLPFTYEEDESAPRHDFFPSVKEVVQGIVPDYVKEYLYGAMTDSFCSEQNARMTAMDSANRNAEKLLEELSVKYDHIRQNTITQEIIEVSAGTARQRNKGEAGQ